VEGQPPAAGLLVAVASLAASLERAEQQIPQRAAQLDQGSAIQQVPWSPGLSESGRVIWPIS